jgi:taurine dioxygenase
MNGAEKAVTITRLSPHTGAEVIGVDLARPLEPLMRARLARAFVRHAVLVVRDQRLDAPQFLAAMHNFGEIFPQHNPRFAVPECPQVHYISNQDKLEDGRVYIPGEGYHTDHSNDPIPPKATALHAVRLPATGGDTQFVNMHEAYEALTAALQRRIEGLMARHVYQSRHSERKLPQLARGRRTTIGAASVVHPLVRTHPESGRKAIYINPIRIEEIVGMATAEALALLEQLLVHASEPRFEYRHRWTVGDSSPSGRVTCRHRRQDHRCRRTGDRRRRRRLAASGLPASGQDRAGSVRHGRHSRQRRGADLLQADRRLQRQTLDESVRRQRPRALYVVATRAARHDHVAPRGDCQHFFRGGDWARPRTV